MPSSRRASYCSSFFTDGPWSFAIAPPFARDDLSPGEERPNLASDRFGWCDDDVVDPPVERLDGLRRLCDPPREVGVVARHDEHLAEVDVALLPHPDLGVRDPPELLHLGRHA